MPGERGPPDFVEAARDRRDFDQLPEYGGIERHRSRSHSSVIAYVGLAATLIIQVGTIAWYGGRLEQRVTNSDNINDRQDRDRDRDREALIIAMREITNENNRQAQTIAGTNVAYLDIARRLQSIEEKLDRRR